MTKKPTKEQKELHFIHDVGYDIGVYETVEKLFKKNLIIFNEELLDDIVCRIIEGIKK